MDLSTSRFAELVGGLMYLATHSRPDISHAVGALAPYMANPTLEHWAAARTVLKYLAGTARLGIYQLDISSTTAAAAATPASWALQTLTTELTWTLGDPPQDLPSGCMAVSSAGSVG